MVRRKNIQLLRNWIFYEQKQMEKDLHLQWCVQRQCPGQKGLDYFSAMSLLNLSFTNEKANWELSISEHPGKHVVDTVVFLIVQCHCNGRSQNSVHLFNPASFQSCSSEDWTKEMSWPAYLTDLECIRFFPCNALQLRCSLTACLKRPTKGVLHAENAERNPFRDIWAADQLNK